jgi:putative exporter of polyketide antibiotics
MWWWIVFVFAAVAVVVFFVLYYYHEYIKRHYVIGHGWLTREQIRKLKEKGEKVIFGNKSVAINLDR